jgi:hypothetical protein
MCDERNAAIQSDSFFQTGVDERREVWGFVLWRGGQWRVMGKAAQRDGYGRVAVSASKVVSGGREGKV